MGRVPKVSIVKKSMFFFWDGMYDHYLLLIMLIIVNRSHDGEDMIFLLIFLLVFFTYVASVWIFDTQS